MKKVIAVCGSDEGDINLSKYALKVAEEVGSHIADENGVLACGGHGGVMEAACKGAKSREGLTLGILPYDKEEANKYVDIALPTQLGNIRNFMVVNSADVVIAIAGRWGTLNEISYAMISKKPVILI
ncbi:MAG: TIGR00725 family protein, partial [Candidatus Thermoplasmatota archaeon]